MKEKIFRKVISTIMCVLMMVGVITPLASLTASAAWTGDLDLAAPGSAKISTVSYTQDGSLAGLVWSNGAVGSCAAWGKATPPNGSAVAYNRGGISGDFYQDGTLGQISNRWAFLCFYYGYKSYSSGAEAKNSYELSFLINMAIRFYISSAQSTYQSLCAANGCTELYNCAGWVARLAREDRESGSHDNIYTKIQKKNEVYYVNRDTTNGHEQYQMYMYYASEAVTYQDRLLYFIRNQYNDNDGYIQVKKLSSDPDYQSDHSLAGAEYSIYKDSGCTQLATSSKLVIGSGNVSNKVTIAPGTYYVKETKAPTGYEMDSSAHKATVGEGATAVVESTDKPLKGQIQVHKKSGNTNFSGSVQGAEYTIYTDAAATQKLSGASVGA